MIFDRHQFAHRLFNTILHNGDIYDIKILLLKSSRINIDLNCLEYNGQSLIHLCCFYNRLDLLKLFIEIGNCDMLTMNRDGWLPLHIAVYLGHMNIVLYLLELIKSSSRNEKISSR
jgi:ankyrin repeat protein